MLSRSRKTKADEQDKVCRQGDFILGFFALKAVDLNPCLAGGREVSLHGPVALKERKVLRGPHMDRAWLLLQ